ncbi:hypothetical protein LJC60_08765 [Ruminococcaceae bacterium OttesenSCG-928-D13]|nr:hypothetical protein [Ruminococcaceae bacterium OttesenSCG-928-D13]
MNYNQLEMRRETIFKDAVLSAAEAKSMQIIGEAQRTAAGQLAEAQAACEEADHDAIKSALAPDNEREHSTALQLARQELLRHRAGLVESLFADVEKQLDRFAESPEYPRWLVCKLTETAGNAQNGSEIEIYMRKDDMKFKNNLLAAASAGAKIAEDETIRLGGIKVRVGKRLYDCTLDDALRLEREQFEETSGMTL